MTPAEYLAEVRRTRSPNTTPTTIQLGLIGEAGEVADLVKKSLERGALIDRDRMIEELGDVLWYVAAKLDAHGLTEAELTEADPDGVSFFPAPESAVMLAHACGALGAARYPFEVQTEAPRVIGLVLSLYAEVEPIGYGGEWLSDLRSANVAKLRKRHPAGFNVCPCGAALPHAVACAHTTDPELR